MWEGLKKSTGGEEVASRILSSASLQLSPPVFYLRKKQKERKRKLCTELGSTKSPPSNAFSFSPIFLQLLFSSSCFFFPFPFSSHFPPTSDSSANFSVNMQQMPEPSAMLRKEPQEERRRSAITNISLLNSYANIKLKIKMTAFSRITSEFLSSIWKLYHFYYISLYSKNSK